MFCTACGAAWQANQRFCANCGRALAIAPVPATYNRVAQHVTLLGILWIARAALRFIGAAVAFGIFHFVLPRMVTDFPFAGLIRASVTMGAAVLLIGAAASLATGLGLLQRESWARPMALVMGFLALLSVPFGTALGVYTLWVLLPAPADSEYRRLSRAA